MSQFDIDFDNHLRLLKEEPWVLEEQDEYERKLAEKLSARKKIGSNRASSAESSATAGPGRKRSSRDARRRRRH